MKDAMTKTDLHYQEISEVAEQIQSGALSSRTLTEYMLARIDGVGKRLNAYITVTADHARAQADQADRDIAAGNYRGPLHGVPLALKDICDMKGVGTTAAMPLRQNHIATEDATVTRRLTEAGAVILGKLNMAEGAYAAHPEPFGPMVNPWDEDAWSGASSGGSGISTTAGLAFGAVASETGGSIRIPSAANSVTGLKPTWGRVSRHGIFELAATLDHIGPICRSARDAGIMLQAMAGQDRFDPTSSPTPVPDYTADLSTDLSGIRVGLDDKWVSTNVEADTAAGVYSTVEVLKSLGARIVPITFPEPDQIIWDWFAVCGPQTAYAHRDTFPKHKDQYTEVLAGQIQQGLNMSAVDYQEVLLRRAHFTGRVNALFEDVDLLISPAIGCRVPSWTQIDEIDNDLIYDIHRFTCVFTMSQHPVICFPSAKGGTKIPVLAQLAGRNFSEALLVRVAHAFQTVTDWHKIRPAI